MFFYDYIYHYIFIYFYIYLLRSTRLYDVYAEFHRLFVQGGDHCGAR